MPITRATAQQLFTKAELKIWLASQSAELKKLTGPALRKKIVMSRRLRDKFRDLAKRQKALAKKTKGTSDVAKRTEKKQQVFTEMLRTFERALATQETQAKRLGRNKKAQKRGLKGVKAARAVKKTKAATEDEPAAATPTLSFALRIKKQALAKKAKGGASKLSLQKGVARKSAAKRVSSHTRASNARRQARRDSR